MRRLVPGVFAFACAAAPRPEIHGPPVPPEPETLAFSTDADNHFFRRGLVAAHLVLTSGRAPRIVSAFPAGNGGVGVWFEPGPEGANTRVSLVGRVEPVERPDGLRGIRAHLRLEAAQLKTRGIVLGSVRILRDFVYRGKVPDEMVNAVEPGLPFVVKRTALGGRHHFEARIEPQGGTTLVPDAGGAVELRAAVGGAVEIALTALSDEEPLHPLGRSALLKSNEKRSPLDERALDALAFLSYEEKLLAGSWRFLTYFGRDTLISVRLLLPELRSEVVEAALGSVIDRLQDDGDVAHEEDIGDFAAFRRLRKDKTHPEPRRPLFDYKMVDDDFLLAPVLAAYLLDTEDGRQRADRFIARRTPDGVAYGEALRRNLTLVLKAAAPYAADPTAKNLVPIRHPMVGDWRDSGDGLAGGRYSFNVNAALVPAALEAAARLLASPALGSDAAGSAEATRLALGWRDSRKHFAVTLSANEARDKASAYARELGIPAPPAVGSPLVFPAISLDAEGRPIPVMHTDDGFVMLFGNPDDGYLIEAAGRIATPFPAGLLTPVGLPVANAAYADEGIRKRFSPQHYHGAVIWSWQQALLAAGLRRQIERNGVGAPAKARLRDAEGKLWQAIAAVRAAGTSELWSWRFEGGRFVSARFGQGGGDADESNAAQLWSTVYLAVRSPP